MARNRNPRGNSVPTLSAEELALATEIAEHHALMLAGQQAHQTEQWRLDGIAFCQYMTRMGTPCVPSDISMNTKSGRAPGKYAYQYKLWIEKRNAPKQAPSFDDILAS